MSFILPLFSQGDPLWRSLPLGTQGRTIGSDGCTVSSLAMLLVRFGITETPATVVTKLKSVDGFEPSGDLRWTAIPRAWPKVHFVWRQYTELETPNFANRKTLAASLIQIRRLIELGQPVLLNVDAVSNDGRPDHWVVAWDVVNGQIVLNDPNGGVKKTLLDFQGKVYGYAVLVGDTAFVPPWSTEAKESHVLFKAAEIKAGRNVPVYSKEIIDDLIG